MSNQQIESAIYSNSNNRTVRTLLMCKVRPSSIHNGIASDYPSAYREIYTGKNGHRYITLGNADAVSIYDTWTVPDTDDTNLGVGSAWFSSLYEDKQQIIFKANEKTNYHPIHLVSNRLYGSRHDKMQVCVITLIYGIRKDAGPWMKEEVSDEHLSSYEAEIQKFIQYMNRKHNCYEYEIYNAVNICDAVIVWYTNDIWTVLADSDNLTSQKLARKTFTLIGFPMNESGTIEDSVYDTIRTSKTPDTPVHIRIQASIRDHDQYRQDLTDIAGALERPNCMQEYLICGQTDLSAVIPHLDNEMFCKLLKHYMSSKIGKNYAYTFWEIHTELMYDDPNPSKDPQTSEKTYPSLPVTAVSPDADYSPIGPVSILDKLFPECLRLSKDRQLKETFPWLGALVEILNVHSNVDRDPILYGPGFLIYHAVKVILFYLKKSKQDPATVEMLQHSRSTIQEYLRALSGLTDQMMRIDDLVFHGFGNNSSLYNTLPECALDFYHSFLLQFIDLLIKVDSSTNRLSGGSENYDYDFLLVPELDQGISIVPMFAADELDRPSAADPDIRALWPAKQAFLVHFPIETVYSPIGFFAPLLHECFHLLGDTCRLRKDRVDHVCGFFADYISTCKLNAGRCCEEHKSIFADLWRIIRDCFPDDHAEPNIPETKLYLLDSTVKVFSNTVFTDLLDNYPESFPDFDPKRWTDIRYGDDIYLAINDCSYLFKEVYADLMMVLTLELSAEAYLGLFKYDMNSAVKEQVNPGFLRDVQRIALILNALSNHQFHDSNIAESWKPDKIERYLQEIDLPNTVVKTIINRYEMLCDESKSLPILDDSILLLYPISSLRHIADYLDEVIEAFNTHFCSEEHLETLRELQKQFNAFFIGGNFISKEYFQIIRDCHEAIRKDYASHDIK